MQAKSLLEKAQMDATMKLRSKVHAQTFGDYEMRRAARTLTPVGKLAVGRITDLLELRAQHQRSFDTSLAVQARQIFRTLPLLTVDEDHNFHHSQRALRVAAYFGITDAPAVHALLSMHTQHSYLMDSQAMGSFFHILSRLRHPQTKEIVRIMLPRVRELAHDLSSGEICAVLSVLSSCDMTDLELVRMLTEVIVNTVDDARLADVRRSALVVSTYNVESGKMILMAAADRLKSEILDSADVTEVRQVILDVCSVVTVLNWAPRRLMIAVARRSIDLAHEVDMRTLASVIAAFHHCSLRHERVLRVLSTVQCGRPSELTVGMVSSTLAALAHFVYLEKEVAATLLAAVTDRLDSDALATVLAACTRCQVRCDDQLQGPIARSIASPPTRVVTSARICWGVVMLRMFRTSVEVQTLEELLKNLMKQRVLLSTAPEVTKYLLDIVRVLHSECSVASILQLIDRLEASVVPSERR